MTSEFIVTPSNWPSSLVDTSSRQAPDGRRTEIGMTAEQQRYRAFMLRLWEVNSDGEPIWRASLESPHTGQRYGFANLELLGSFLEEQADWLTTIKPVTTPIDSLRMDAGLSG